MRKPFNFVLLTIILLGIFGTTIVTDKSVEFSDFNLEIEVRQMIGNLGKPIYRSQLLDIFELDLADKEISDLSGIEHLRNLEILILSHNQVQDVSPLKTLSSLRVLNLQDNGIIDLEAAKFNAIASLNLTELYLDNNWVHTKVGGEIRLSDISLIQNFRSLQILGLSKNRIKDISPLAQFSNLQDLNLSGNQIQNIAGLKNLNKLEVLDLSRNKVTDITSVARLTNLNRLNLRENQIIDISVVKNLTNLEYLNIHSNSQIRSVTPIGDLVNLRTLIMREVQIKDQVWIFSHLRQLSQLNVRDCKIDDYSVFGALMAQGALQDDAENQLPAVLNIRDNFLQKGAEDPLAAIRPYWGNITYREPYFLPNISGLINPPEFSKPGGFFINEFELSLHIDNSRYEIYYTMDGSDPKPAHVDNPKSPYQISYKYEAPILIQNLKGKENVFSMINTTHVENEISWMPPKNEVYKANIVRAISYDPQSGIQSTITTHTYFVDENVHDRYSTMPVISIAADYEALFEPETGIMNTGSGENPFSHLERRVPANLEFFEIGGKTGFDGLYEIKLHGNTSVANPQKAFHVFVEPWLGEEIIQYPIFKDSLTKANQLTAFSRFILRAWGTAVNWEVFFSDAYHQTLLADADLDIQGYRPVVVFINGEYWGLYELREAIKNPDYFQSHYFNWQDVPLDILELGTEDFVDEGDPENWFALLDYIDSHDMQNSAAYAYVQTQMDVDNFIKYVVHCVYTGKKDWPVHNEAMWRPRTPDGKWRWIQFDMDQGLRAQVDSLYDMVYHVTNEDVNPHRLLLALLENEEFKYLFFNTFADLLNTNFLTSVEFDHFNKMSDQLEMYMPEYRDRWQMDFDWDKNKALALDLIDGRWVFRKNQMLDNFNELRGTREITLMFESSMGKIKINSIVVTEDFPGVYNTNMWTGYYFRGIPVNVSAIPNPGYRFVDWESSIEINSDHQDLTINLSQDFSLKANFESIVDD